MVNAYRGSGGVVTPIRNSGSRLRSNGQTHVPATLPPGKADPVAIQLETEWRPELQRCHVFVLKIALYVEYYFWFPSVYEVIPVVWHAPMCCDIPVLSKYSVRVLSGMQLTVQIRR